MINEQRPLDGAAALLCSPVEFVEPAANNSPHEPLAKRPMRCKIVWFLSVKGN